MPLGTRSPCADHYSAFSFLLSGYRFCRGRPSGDAQQLLCFLAETPQFFFLDLVLGHPRVSLVVPAAGFVLVAKLPMGHRQKEPVARVAAGDKFDALIQSVDRLLPVARTVLCNAESGPGL